MNTSEEYTDEYYFDHLPQPVHQLTEIKDELSKHKISSSPWVNAENSDERLYLNSYKKMYKVCISKVFGYPYEAPGYKYLFDNMFLEFNLEPSEREYRAREAQHKIQDPDTPYQREQFTLEEIKDLNKKWFKYPYTKDEIQEMKTAKFELCEKLSGWGLVDTTTLYQNDRQVSLWKPSAERVSMTKPQDRTI